MSAAVLSGESIICVSWLDWDWLPLVPHHMMTRLAQHNRVLFVVHNRREQARFNNSADWRTAPPAPLDMGMQRDGLRNATVPRRGPRDI